MDEGYLLTYLVIYTFFHLINCYIIVIHPNSSTYDPRVWKKELAARLTVLQHLKLLDK